MVLTVFMTIFNSGLRTSECLLLRRKDINVVSGREIIITVRAETSKVRKTRQVPVMHSGGLWLRDWLRQRELKPDDLVFAVAKRGAHNSFYRGFKQFRETILKPEGLEDADPYHARHQWCTDRLMSGESIHLVAKLAGSSTTEIERTYSNVIDLNIGREFGKKKLRFNEDGTIEVIKREDEVGDLKRALEKLLSK